MDIMNKTTTVMILSIVNQIVKNYVYKTYRIKSLKDNIPLVKKYAIKEDKKKILRN